MPIGLILDIFVVIVIGSAVISGLSRGFVRALGTTAGIIAGGAAALIVMPVVSAAIPLYGWNVAGAIAAGIALVMVGIAIGEAIANLIRKPVHRVGLGIIDRLLGAVTGFVVSVALLMMAVMSVGSFGVPGVAQAVASSTVLRFIDERMPAPVESALARIRSIALEDGIPLLLDSAGAGTAEVPDADSNTPALRKVSESVPRISANAPECRATSSGSGFVIGDGLIMTNAHVVTGARDVVVELPGDIPRTASVVYYDAETDIALLAAADVDAAPLPFSVTPEAEATVFFQGYPYGGPFSSRSAAVLGTTHTAMYSSDGTATAPRSVVRIAGNVNPGNSGGPLLDADGAVVGMIFAQAEGVANVGFALSMEELAPVLALAPELTAPVATGSCG